MTVHIDLQKPPDAIVNWETDVWITPTIQLVDIPHFEMPFVEGELSHIEGLFKGIAACPVEGDVDLVVHENLSEVTGNLTVYDGQTQQSLFGVLRMTTWMASGISARFPKTSLRIRVKYALEWTHSIDPEQN